jgi:Rap1a immunity proteins
VRNSVQCFPSCNIHCSGRNGPGIQSSSDMSAFRLAVFTLLVLCWGSGAPAQMKANSFIDAATLLRICDNDTPEFKKICHAYLSGIADGVTASQATGTSKPLLCIPPGTTPSHLRAALRASLKQHDSLDFGGGSSALAAILFAYPCPAGR